MEKNQQKSEMSPNGGNTTAVEIQVPTDRFDRIRLPDPYENPMQNKPKCFGGCSETIKKQNWLEELMNSEKSGNSISTIAHEVATNAVFAKLEFLLGQTLFHVSFDKKPGNRWENGGKDLVELFNPDKPGGERGYRYQQLKESMHGAKVGMVFSEPTVEDNLNYIHVFVDMGSTVEEYIVQHKGTIEDFSNLYSTFSATADSAVSSVDFSIPLRFNQDVPLESFIENIERSYVSEENREQSHEYLTRLKRDIKNLPKIDAYQKEAEELASYLEKQMLMGGISHGLLDALAGDLDSYATGTQTVEHLAESHDSESAPIPGVYTYIQNETADIGSQYLKENQQISSAVRMVLEVVDGFRGDGVLFALSDEAPPVREPARVARDRWIDTAKRELNVSRSEAVLLEQSLVRVYTLFKKQEKNLDMVGEIHAGYGALFYALDVLAFKDFPPVTDGVHLAEAGETVLVSAENKTPSLAEQDEQRVNVGINEIAESTAIYLDPGPLEYVSGLSPKEKSEIFTVLVEQDISGIFSESKIGIPLGIDTDSMTEAVRFIRKLDKLPASRREHEIISKKRIKLTELFMLWTQLREISGKQSDVLSIHSPHEMVSIRREFTIESDHVDVYSIALAMWTLLKIANSYANLEYIHKTAVALKSGSLTLQISEKNPGALMQKEPAPWLLFVIILQMAMIREQGYAQSQQQPSGTNTKKSKNASILPITYFPQHGVIFVLHS